MHITCNTKDQTKVYNDKSIMEPQYPVLSDKLASSESTDTLEDFSKKLLSHIYMYISNITEIIKLSD